jgi:acyl-coenzyme A synthetase/AMP-(fatty) acid ligase
MPMTPTGKIVKSDLKKLAEGNHPGDQKFARPLL